MQLPTRHTRVRRLLAVSAAAVAVMIAPTACDYGGFNGGSSSHDMNGDMGDMPGMDHGTPQHQEVVPVANTRQDNSGDDANQERRRGRGNRPTTTPPTTTTAAPTSTSTAPTDPNAPVTDPSATDTTTAPPVAAGVSTVGAGGKDGKNNGLAVQGRDCATGTNAKLPVHDGFQDPGATCVQTQMGAVAAKGKLPSLLITEAPRVVGMNQAFTLKVATRNLNRNRFLGAKAGGYYLESSFLDGGGIQEGHFHTACRLLPTTNSAPDSSVDPAFFLATEDGKSDTAPVTIPVPAIGKPGILQCSSWAGDGSHRTPMMTQANETPAFDSVRIFVTRRDQPVRFDGRGARADSNANIAAQSQPGQKADAKPAAPAAPNAAAAPATAIDDAGNPIADDAAPAAPSDGVDDAPAAGAPAADAPAPTGGN